MKILGIHDGHTATVALLDDGKIRAVISEERLNRIKEYHGFPKLAVKKVLDITNTKPGEIELVVIAYKTKPISYEQYVNKKFSLNRTAFNFVNKIMPRRFMKSNIWVPYGVNALSMLRNKEEV